MDSLRKVYLSTKLVARERINKLLDSNSFVEIGMFVKHRSTDFNMEMQDTPSDGVITGYGTIEGRLVFVYSQDSSVLGGAVGEMHARKITRLYKEAMKMGAPIIAFIDSAGIRLQENIDALEGYGSLFMHQSQASGVIPQISIVCGDCAGLTGLIAGFSDFVFIVKESTKVFLNSSNTILKDSTTFIEMANPEIDSKQSGLVHFIDEDEDRSIEKVRSLLSYLPSNNIEGTPIYKTNDDINRISQELSMMDVKEIDIEKVIQSIADEGRYFEIQDNFAPNVTLGFIRLNGATIAVIANQPKYNKGKLDILGIRKITRFTNFSDAFNMPILTIANSKGFISDAKSEKFGVISEIAKMTNSFAKATVPKVCLLVGESYGGAYLAMNSKHIGADFVYAWQTAQVGIMDAEAATYIMYGDELKNSSDPLRMKKEKIGAFNSIQNNPYTMASRGYIDDIIEPSNTRKYMITTFEMLYSKKESRPRKKNSTL